MGRGPPPPRPRGARDVCKFQENFLSRIPLHTRAEPYVCYPENIREELLRDMVLAPLAGVGGGPRAPPQLLPNPSLGISATCSNSEPTETPLRWLWMRGRKLLRVEVRGSAFYYLLPERQVFQSIAFCSTDPRPVGSEAGDGTCPGQLISP
ncbi:interferon regulatory factor 3-like [Canis lupus familiaris]|uniref:interferon regulatory factor 3-like n=1 Tax=Canis lupus familiaris TaxID=9615 RepID=UPI0018F723C1|nr:interferon regulatory factor 3-like [Canis lupus familiaris]XP_038513813.1 interferon regulatory factor 3-like [Canis lupus familiaris]